MKKMAVGVCVCPGKEGAVTGRRKRPKRPLNELPLNPYLSDG